ncbi:MAG: F0F1 ATP synthase subunit delta, partial [Sulfitobacter geojensis]
MDVSETASISTGIAQRYASAVFDIAKEGKQIKAIEADLDALQG